MEFVFLIFFTSLYLILHTYVFYPASIKILTLFFKRKYSLYEKFSPKVSILISAYNEEKVIAKTLENFCQLNYPGEKFEVVIGSDGSTDQTNNIISQFTSQHLNIIFIPFEKRRGKKFVINDLVKKANGEILIFSDSNTLYDKDAINHLVKFYNDDRVGGVSGRLELIEEAGSTEAGNKEATYWKYESWIKDSEGKLGALIGANGGIYSIKREYFVPMPENVSVVDDLYLSLKVIDQNKDFLYCKDALAKEILAPSVKWEFDRKVRIIPRSFDTIKQVKKLLLTKRLFVSYGLWSHKLIRWITPILFIFLFLSSFVLSFYLMDIFYHLIFIIQSVIILFGTIGYFFSRKNLNIKIFQLCFYFIITNYALIKGIYRYVTKKYKPTWDPTPR